MSDAETTPPHAGFAANTPDNHSAWVLVTTYIFVLIAVLVTVVRLTWRWKVTRNIVADDTLITIATIFGVAQTAAITVACNNGLGRHQDVLSASEFDTFNESYYASAILGVLCMGLAKASMTCTIIALRPLRGVLLGCYGLLVTIALWTVASVFALAFQCNLPKPWMSTRNSCVDQYALQIAVGTLNIATDVGIVLMPMILMPRVQVTKKQRFVVQALFGCRLVVPVFTILNLVSLNDLYHSNPLDQPWFAVTASIYSQIMINLSLITACIPSIKRFLAELQTGAFGAEVTGDFELSLSGNNTAKDYGQRSTGSVSVPVGLGSRFGFSSRKSQIRSQISSIDREKLTPNMENDNTTNGVRRTHSGYGMNPPSVYDSNYPTRTKVERSDSVRGLTDHVIMQTIDYKVEYEDKTGQGKHSRDAESRSSRGDEISIHAVR